MRIESSGGDMSMQIIPGEQDSLAGPVGAVTRHYESITLKELEEAKAGLQIGRASCRERV